MFYNNNNLFQINTKRRTFIKNVSILGIFSQFNLEEFVLEPPIIDSMIKPIFEVQSLSPPSRMLFYMEEYGGQFTEIPKIMDV